MVNPLEMDRIEYLENLAKSENSPYTKGEIRKMIKDAKREKREHEKELAQINWEHKKQMRLAKKLNKHMDNVDKHLKGIDDSLKVLMK